MAPARAKKHGNSFICREYGRSTLHTLRKAFAGYPAQGRSNDQSLLSRLEALYPIHTFDIASCELSSKTYSDCVAKPTLKIVAGSLPHKHHLSRLFGNKDFVPVFHHLETCVELLFEEFRLPFHQACIDTLQKLRTGHLLSLLSCKDACH